MLVIIYECAEYEFTWGKIGGARDHLGGLLNGCVTNARDEIIAVKKIYFEIF